MITTLLLLAGEARAQSDPAPATRAAPVIVPPKLLSTADVPYPEGATGDASVILVVVVSAAGSVVSATPEQNNEPFSSRAAAAALGWRFEPAQRDGTAIAAKIRLEVVFRAPIISEEPAL